MPEKQATQPNAFEKLYKKKLSSDEQEEMKHNLFGYLELLLEIDREQKERKND
jgi:hypothetical protein